MNLCYLVQLLRGRDGKCRGQSVGHGGRRVLHNNRTPGGGAAACHGIEDVGYRPVRQLTRECRQGDIAAQDDIDTSPPLTRRSCTIVNYWRTVRMAVSGSRQISSEQACTCSRALTGVPLQGLSEDEQKRARRAIAEYQNSLLARADYPETQMQIAGFTMTQRKFDAAQAAFKEALSMDPQLAQAWITLARIQWALPQIK